MTDQTAPPEPLPQDEPGTEDRRKLDELKARLVALLKMDIALLESPGFVVQDLDIGAKDIEMTRREIREVWARLNQ